MQPSTSRFRNTAVLAIGLAASLTGCAGLPDGAVPGCPVCGDPVTRVGPDGHAEVLPRWRLTSWRAPEAAAPSEATGAVPVR